MCNDYYLWIELFSGFGFEKSPVSFKYVFIALVKYDLETATLFFVRIFDDNKKLGK